MKAERRGIGTSLIAIIIIVLVIIAGAGVYYLSSSKTASTSTATTGTTSPSSTNSVTTSSGLASSSIVSSSSKQSTASPEYAIGSVGYTFNLCSNQLSPGNVNGSNGGQGCGLEPDAVLPNPANDGNVYVSHVWNLTVFKGTYNAPASYIVGTATSEQMVYDPANNLIYATNYEAYGPEPNLKALVSVINPVTGIIVKNITVGNTLYNDINEWGIALDVANGDLYVAVYCDSGSCDNSNVSVISTTTNTVVKTLTGFGNCGSAEGCLLSGLMYDPASNDVYVGYLTASNITLIDAATNRVTGNINLTLSAGLDSNPVAFAYDPTNGYVYAAEQGTSLVTVLNATSNTVVETIGSLYYNSTSHVDTYVGGEYNGTQPWGIAFDSAKSYLYVANFQSDDLTVINCATNTIIGTIAVGPSPRGVAYDPVSGYIYVVNHFGDTVSIIV